jgi:arylsulfatase A-like enzyme
MAHVHQWRLVWLGVLAAIGVSGLRLLPTRPDLNILLITLDTTRADHLGAYGFQSIATPNLDRLARDGVLFEQTETVAPLTLPAHASLLTGRFPPAHGVRDNAGFALDTRETTLADLLRTRGYRTGAFVASSVLASGRGLSRGFDVYRDVIAPPAPRGIPGGVRRPANEVTDEALKWIAGVATSRFFAWVHFYDAHRPYDVPEPYHTQYVGRPYDGAIAFMDGEIGRLLAFLQQRGLLTNTIVVAVGDHGESLGDHGEASHAVFVYESVTRVPFIVRAPFTPLRGRIVDDVTRSIDVMPTLLDLLGVRSPATVEGTSLVPLMNGTARRLNLEAYAESLYPRYRYGWSELHALRAGRFKVIAAPRPELYDLQTDPFEEHNEYDARRALGEQMIARLRELERRSGGSAAGGHAPVAVDSETALRLAALGYVSRSGSARKADEARALADPKDQIGLLDPEGRP